MPARCGGAVFGMGMKVANIMLFQIQEPSGGLNKVNGNIANDKKAIKALKKERWKTINLLPVLHFK